MTVGNVPMVVLLDLSLLGRDEAEDFLRHLRSHWQATADHFIDDEPTGTCGAGTEGTCSETLPRPGTAYPHSADDPRCPMINRKPDR
jgi:hypothetical protein